MYVLTTDSIPFAVTVKEVFSMIESTYPADISKKGFFRSIMEANKNDHQLAYDSFVAGVRNAYPQANFVIGTKVSTAVGSINNEIFLIHHIYRNTCFRRIGQRAEVPLTSPSLFLAIKFLDDVASIRE